MSVVLAERIQWNHHTVGLDHTINAGIQPQDSKGLTQVLKPFTAKHDQFHDPEVQNDVAVALLNHDDKFADLGRNIRTKVLGGKRFAVVTNTGFNDFAKQGVDPDIYRDTYLLGINTLVGRPTVTSPRDNKVIWNVHFDPHSVGAKDTTFTQTDGEASLHTDSTFRKVSPEQVFSLACVAPDSTGNGVTTLMDATMVASVVKETDPDAARTLQETLFPFNTPTVFTASGSDAEKDIFSAPIVMGEPNGHQITRWNKMGIEKAVKRRGEPLSGEQMHAITVWEAALNRRDLAYDFFLPQGAILFVENQELLHARTAVGDRKRRLKRTRVDPHARDFSF